MNNLLLGWSLPLASGLSLHLDATLGYVGPAGIGALGVLLVVVLVLLIGAVGLVLYPVRLILRRRRRLEQEQNGTLQDAHSSQSLEERT